MKSLCSLVIVVWYSKMISYYYCWENRFDTWKPSINSKCNIICCKTNPCLNGGTCSEHCDNITVKYSCSCVAGFTGKVSEAQLSCATYFALDNSVPNGVCEISDGTQVVLRLHQRAKLYLDSGRIFWSDQKGGLQKWLLDGHSFKGRRSSILRASLAT